MGQTDPSSLSVHYFARLQADSIYFADDEETSNGYGGSHIGEFNLKNNSFYLYYPFGSLNCIFRPRVWVAPNSCVEG